ncbi:MAG: hypothetical protein C4527_01305 [Candidatus Omnitrophota bacterium]|jgi:hypothetical protein|nr:MAG: hypothetical protein C4527_01305 [Candidatus Omnitrophota bacterium]
MTVIGWIIFLVSNAIVISLTTFCFYRVFSIPEEHMHATLDIDTKDLHDEEEDEEFNADEMKL